MLNTDYIEGLVEIYGDTVLRIAYTYLKSMSDAEMKFFTVLCCFRQDIASLPLWLGKRNMGFGQFIHSNILLKTYFFDSLKTAVFPQFYFIIASRKALSAAPRWLILFFSSAVSSAIVALNSSL